MQMLAKPPPEVIHAMRQLNNSPAWETLSSWLQSQREVIVTETLTHTTPTLEPLMRQKQGAARLISDVLSLSDTARN